MSRIGKWLVKIPSDVEVSYQDRILKVKGPKGELEQVIHYEVELEILDQTIQVKKVGKTRLAPAMWGTTRALINNMIIGVTQGFKKQLELHGVGYKMAIQGKKLILNVGFSHPVEFDIPEGVNTVIEKEVISFEGADKQKVGQFAAVVRGSRKVEPYKGKGFRYVGEVFIKKEGKKTAG